MWRTPTISQAEGIPEGTFVEGESMFYDGQGREPAGCSFLPGGCLAFCKLLDSLSVNTLAVIRLRWRRVVRALFFTAICSLLASVG